MSIQNYRKSTLNAFFTDSEAVEENGLFSFPVFKTTGTSVKFNGGTSVSIVCPGLYHIIANVSGAAASGSGNLTIQINRNGSAIVGTALTSFSTATTDIREITTGTIIEVLPSCASIDNTAVITVSNIGVDGDFIAGNLQIVKLA